MVARLMVLPPLPGPVRSDLPIGFTGFLYTITSHYYFNNTIRNKLCLWEGKEALFFKYVAGIKNCSERKTGNVFTTN